MKKQRTRKCRASAVFCLKINGEYSIYRGPELRAESLLTVFDDRLCVTDVVASYLGRNANHDAIGED